MCLTCGEVVLVLDRLSPCPACRRGLGCCKASQSAGGLISFSSWRSLASRMRRRRRRRSFPTLLNLGQTNFVLLLLLFFSSSSFYVFRRLRSGSQSSAAAAINFAIEYFGVAAHPSWRSQREQLSLLHVTQVTDSLADL